MKHIYTRSEDLWTLLAALAALCFRPLAGKGRRTDPIMLPFPVRREQFYFSVALLSNNSALVTGLELLVLLLFVILALRGLCSDGFQEHCGAAGQGWRCCASSFVLTPTNEIGLCAPRHGKGRQRWWAPSLHHWTGDFSAAVKLGNKSPTDPGCLWLGHGVDLTSTQRCKRRWTLPREFGTWNALRHSKYWFGNLVQANLILMHSTAVITSW